MALDVSYLSAFGAGALSFLSPCVLPLVPPYLCYMAGVSFDRFAEQSGMITGVGRNRLRDILQADPGTDPAIDIKQAVLPDVHFGADALRVYRNNAVEQHHRSRVRDYCANIRQFRHSLPITSVELAPPKANELLNAQRK